jgi:hypothetical protein
MWWHLLFWFHSFFAAHVQSSSALLLWEASLHHPQGFHLLWLPEQVSSYSTQVIDNLYDRFDVEPRPISVTENTLISLTTIFF